MLPAAENGDAPLLFWGHSGGAQFGPTFAAMQPDRTIGFIAYQAWPVRASDVKTLSQVPALSFSDREVRMTPITDSDSWKSSRSSGAPWTFAPQWDAPHGDPEYLQKANDLAIPWIAAVLYPRLPTGGRTLQPINVGSGWLASNRTGEVASFIAFSGSKEETSWLPDEPSARGWGLVTGMTK